MSMANKYQIG